MMKRLLTLVAFVMAFVGSTFALNMGDYAFTMTQRLKITGENLIPDGAFPNARDGWTDAEGNAVSAETWDFLEGVGPNGENALVSLGATEGAALCNKWQLEGGSYVVRFDIKGSAVSSLPVIAGQPNYCDFFVNTDGALTKVASTDEAPVINVATSGQGYSDAWSTVTYYFTAEQGQYLVMHFERLNTETMVTNIELYPAVEVYDIRSLQRKLDYVAVLENSQAFTNDYVNENGTSFLEVVGMMREWVANNDPVLEDVTTVNEMLAEYDALLLGFLNANSADLLKDEKRWSTLGDTRKQNGMNEGKPGYNWKGSGGRWFHKNNGGSDQITDNGDEIGHRLQGGNKPGAATQYYTIKPNFAGTYMFSLDVLGYYMSGATKASGAQYIPDYSTPFLGCTVYAGKDVMGSDAAANAEMNNEQEGQKIDLGDISNPFANTYTVFYMVSQEQVDAGQEISFGITYVPNPDGPQNMGSNVNIANPQIRVIGHTQFEIDYLNEVGRIIVQQAALGERLALAREDLTKTAQDGYPWGKPDLTIAIETAQPTYDGSLNVMDLEGNVKDEAFIVDYMNQAEAGTAVVYSDSLLHTVQAMNSARNAYTNVNQPVANYRQKVADAEAVYADDFYSAGKKQEFRAAIDAAIAKLDEILASTTDETRVVDDSLMTLQLTTLAEAVEAFKVSGEPTPFVDIDFSNPFEAAEEVAYIIKGAAGQMNFDSANPENNNADGDFSYALGAGEELLDVLRVGNTDAVVPIAEADQPGDDQVLRVTFDLWYGNLSGRTCGVQLQNAAGERVAGYTLNRYNGVVDFNDFNNEANTGLDVNAYVTAIGSSSQSNSAICVDNNRSSFTLIVDYKAKAVKGVVTNPQRGTCTGELVAMNPELTDTKIAKIVLNSNYNNKDRRCWFDNLKAYKYASSAEGPFVDGISTIANDTVEKGIFTLSGQKVEKAVKGLYIVNGKKVLVK